jgi:hypothetical protein
VAFGVDPAAVDCAGEHVVDLDDLRIGQRVVGLQPRELDDLADQVGEPGGLDAHPAGEPAYGLGVVGRVLDRLGQQSDGTDRRLQLVTGVGDEVASGLLDPPSRGLVVGEHDDQVVAQWRDLHDEVRRRGAGAALELELL